jgi:hypothetical protein
MSDKFGWIKAARKDAARRGRAAQRHGPRPKRRKKKQRRRTSARNRERLPGVKAVNVSLVDHVNRMLDEAAMRRRG